MPSTCQFPLNLPPKLPQFSIFTKNVHYNEFIKNNNQSAKKLIIIKNHNQYQQQMSKNINFFYEIGIEFNW